MRTLPLAALAFLTPCCSCYAADVLVAVMQDLDHKQSIHYQSVPGDSCDLLLAQFRSLSAKKTPMQLTLEDPPFSGYVVELNCVRPDGQCAGHDPGTRLALG